MTDTPEDVRDDILAHYGVKGMKWGVTRSDPSGGTRAERKVSKLQDTADRNRRIAEGTASRKDKIDQAVFGKGMKGFGGAVSLSPKVAARMAAKYDKKADKAQQKIDDKARKEATLAAHKKWKEEAGGTEMANKVFQKAAKDFEKTANIINNDPNYKDKDVTKGIVGRQYQATMNHYFNQHLAQASVDLTLNDRGRAYIYQYDARSGLMKGTEHRLSSVEIEHAEGSKFEMPDYSVELDDQGHMISFNLVGELYHYGVKGMKWGVSKKSGDSSPVDVTAAQKKPGTRVKATGGQNQPASKDAVRAATSRQKARASTIDALTNDELKDVVKRMQLEQQYSQLSAQRNVGPMAKGHSMIKNLLGVADTANRAYNLQNTPLSQALKTEIEKEKAKIKADRAA